MKKIYKYLPYLAVVIMLVLSVIAINFFSNKGISQLINYAFALVMFLSLIFVLRYTFRYTRLIEDLKTGTNILKRLDKRDIDNISSAAIIFKNFRLIEVFNSFLAENSKYDCEISDYVNEDLLDEEINRHVSDVTSGFMTGLGLLGTFIGFMVGIKDLKINQNELMDGIKAMLDGMKTAFLTSIFGVIYSILFNAYYNYIYSYGLSCLSEFQDIVHKKITENPETKNINQLLEYQRRQSKNSDELPAIVARSVAREIDRVFTPTINKMDSLMEKFVETATEAQQENMKLLVDSFIECMNKTLNDRFIMFGETLEKTSLAQIQNYEMMSGIIAEINDQYENLSVIKQSIEKSLSDILQYEAGIHKYTESIISNNHESANLLEKIKEAQLKTHGSLQTFISKMGDASSYINKLENVVNKQKEFIDELKNSNIEIIDHNAEIYRRLSDKTAETFGNYNNAMVENIHSIETCMSAFGTTSKELADEIKKIEGNVRSECDDIEKTLGSSLEKALGEFDTNLADITKHFNTSVNELKNLVDSIHPALYKSISKLKVSIEECVKSCDTKGISREDD